jgi:hypothetical protein
VNEERKQHIRSQVKVTRKLCEDRVTPQEAYALDIVEELLGPPSVGESITDAEIYRLHREKRISVDTLHEATNTTVWPQDREKARALCVNMVSAEKTMRVCPQCDGHCPVGQCYNRPA